MFPEQRRAPAHVGWCGAQFDRRTQRLDAAEPVANTPVEFAAFIKSEVDTNTALLRDAGYKPE